MDISDIDPPYRQFITDLLMRKGFDPKTFCTEIGPGDEMFHKAIVPGYQGNVGRSLFKYVESALRSFDMYRGLADSLGGFDRLGSVLDFGSGWGRMTRTLVPHLPAERIWVSDIYHDAIAWQAERFGVNAVVSVSNPDRFALPARYSIVMAGSVFSHLPASLFHRWVDRLMRLVETSGLLAFSVHPETLLSPGDLITAEGMHYLHESESASLATDIYGMAYVTEGFVARAIRESERSRPLNYLRIKKGLYENQDLYVVSDASSDLSRVRTTITPMCGVSYVSNSEQFIEISGWAIDLNPGHKLNRAELYQAEKMLSVMTPIPGEESVAVYFPAAPNTPLQWSFRVLSDRVHSKGFLRVVLYSTSGSLAYCYLGPMEFDSGQTIPHT